MHQILAFLLALAITIEVFYFLYYFMGKYFNFGKTYFYISFYQKYIPKKFLRYSIIANVVLLVLILLI